MGYPHLSRATSAPRPVKKGFLPRYPVAVNCTKKIRLTTPIFMLITGAKKNRGTSSRLCPFCVRDFIMKFFNLLKNVEETLQSFVIIFLFDFVCRFSVLICLRFVKQEAVFYDPFCFSLFFHCLTFLLC